MNIITAAWIDIVYGGLDSFCLQNFNLYGKLVIFWVYIRFWACFVTEIQKNLSPFVLIIV